MLLLSGLAGMGVSLCVPAFGFSLGPGSLVGRLTAARRAASVASFAIGLGPVFRRPVSEIFPLSVRARGMAASTFLDLADGIGRVGVFLLHAAMAEAAFGCARAMVPETDGLTLEAIRRKRAAQAVPVRAGGWGGRRHGRS